jgi:hypothetical protein
MDGDGHLARQADFNRARQDTNDDVLKSANIRILLAADQIEISESQHLGPITIYFEKVQDITYNSCCIRSKLGL